MPSGKNLMRQVKLFFSKGMADEIGYGFRGFRVQSGGKELSAFLPGESANDALDLGNLERSHTQVGNAGSDQQRHRHGIAGHFATDSDLFVGNG